MPWAPGDTIVVLEDREPRRDVARLQEQIALKETARRQVDLDLARDRADLASQRSIKELELASLRYEVSRNRELFGLGLVSYDQVRKSETDSARATIELAHLQTRLANAEQDRDTALATLEGEMAILATDLEQGPRAAGAHGGPVGAPGHRDLGRAQRGHGRDHRARPWPASPT